MIREDPFTTNILGTEYTVYIESADSDPRYEEMSGWTDWTVKEIHVGIPKRESDTVKDLSKFRNTTIRHEIIHAYLQESGLDCNSLPCDTWATNEEMVDWFAIMLPKINRTCEEIIQKI